MPHLPDRHQDHDPALLAAFAAGDATGAELEQARELVATCTPCAGLHDDLVAIAAAVHALPPPRRTRDYRLTADQAASLRPAGWRRLLAPFAGPGFRLAAPLGTTMATLGVAALLITALPGASLFGTASTPTGGGPEVTQIEGDGGQPPAEASPAASMAAPAPWAAAPSASAPSVAGESPLDIEGGSGSTPADTNGEDLAGGDGDEPPTPRERSAEAMAVRAADETALIVGGMLVLLGAALIALRWTARRLA